MEIQEALRIVQNALNERKALAKVQEVLLVVQQAETRSAELAKEADGLRDEIQSLKLQQKEAMAGLNEIAERADNAKSAADWELDELYECANYELEAALAKLPVAKAELAEVRNTIAAARAAWEGALEGLRDKADHEQLRLDTIKAKIDELKKM